MFTLFNLAAFKNCLAILLCSYTIKLTGYRTKERERYKEAAGERGRQRERERGSKGKRECQ